MSRPRKRPEPRTVKNRTVGTYLGTFPVLPLLTPAEEVRLGNIVRKGGVKAEGAKTRLILHNTRLVVSQAMKYAGRNATTQAEKDENLINLTGEGMFGLMEAAERFDPARGCRFSTYATYWIRRFVFKALNQNRIIRVPYYMHGLLAKIPWAWSVLTSEKAADDITDADMAEKLKCTVSEYQRTLAITNSTHVYLPNSDLSAKEEGDHRDAFDTIDLGSDSPDGAAEDSERRNLLWVALGLMDDTLSHILMLRYGFGVKKKYTLSEVSDILGLDFSRERVRQMEHDALREFTRCYHRAKNERLQDKGHPSGKREV